MNLRKEQVVVLGPSLMSRIRPGRLTAASITCYSEPNNLGMRKVLAQAGLPYTWQVSVAIELDVT